MKMSEKSVDAMTRGNDAPEMIDDSARAFSKEDILRGVLSSVKTALDEITSPATSLEINCRVVTDVT